LGKVILQASMAVFLGALKKLFGQICLSPLEITDPYAYDFCQNFITIDYNFELYRFKVYMFFETQCITCK